MGQVPATRLIAGLALTTGLIGAWFLWAAVSQYNSTIRAFTEISVAYQPGTLEWLDPEFSAARATIVFHNNAPALATVSNVNLRVLFDGAFAGTNYERFERLALAPGETRSIELEFQISTPGVQARGGVAHLQIDGYALIQFDGIDRALTLNVADEVGVVPWRGP